MWNNATQKYPKVFHPSENGWVLANSKYTLNWFDGELAPPTLEDMVVEEAEADDDEQLNESESDEMVDSSVSDED
ncbi:hypothetical protein GHT06_011242 [Daphnia sinensis]|nr:hypothetical protein GHT06_011242 [Daphnia sinensis]